MMALTKRTFQFIILLMFFVGCASKIAYISSQTDRNYALVKTDPIFFILEEKASMAERQMYPLLKEEMIANGFNIVEDALNAKWALFFDIGSKTSRHNSTRQVATTSYSSGKVGDTYYSGTTKSTQAIPYSYNYTVKKIYMFLYAWKEIGTHKMITAWEGYIGAGEKEYKSYLRAIFKSLLTHSRKPRALHGDEWNPF